jgi:hypothetical protein
MLLSLSYQWMVETVTKELQSSLDLSATVSIPKPEKEPGHFMLLFLLLSKYARRMSF